MAGWRFVFRFTQLLETCDNSTRRRVSALRHVKALTLQTCVSTYKRQRSYLSCGYCENGGAPCGRSRHQLPSRQGPERTIWCLEATDCQPDSGTTREFY